MKEGMDAFNTSLFDSIQSHLWTGSAEFTNNLPHVFQTQWKLLEPSMKNSYLILLDKVGILGLVLLLLFFIQVLLLNLRLIKEIPNTHLWHKVVAIGAICAQINLHISALYFPVFNHTQMIYLFAILISTLFYFDNAYGRGIVPDDSCL